jgi:hypothetical protein
MLLEIAIVQPPQLGAVRPDEKVETCAIRQLIVALAWLALATIVAKGWP